MEFYKTLICWCGKEFGEIQFSGYEPGKWRILEDRMISEEKLNKLKEYMQIDFFKELQEMLDKMGKM
jgi:hypothetical protein